MGGATLVSRTDPVAREDPLIPARVMGSVVVPQHVVKGLPLVLRKERLLLSQYDNGIRFYEAW
jgi:hypothetical protein